jgi:SAM-dependent methyltransferase
MLAMTRYTDFINYNLRMLTDQARMNAYRRALISTVQPNDVVLDLGCGSGILSFFACQAGARMVYAIEAEPVIELAKQVSRHNRLDDRITFLNAHSFRVSLPERVDVIVTETMGAFGMDEGMVGSLIDARTRFLRQGGTVIPQRITFFLVPVEMPGFYEHMVQFWMDGSHGVDFSPIRQLAANHFHPIKFHETAYLSEPSPIADADLQKVLRSDIDVHRRFTATRAGVCHGLCGWFVAQLTPAIRLSNGPADQDAHWGSAFFPLQRPVRIQPGTPIEVTMQSSGNGSLWSWCVTINRDRFAHATPITFTMLPADERRLLPDASPTLSPQGRAELFALSMLNGQTAIADVQAELCKNFPELLISAEQAAVFLQEILVRAAYV